MDSSINFAKQVKLEIASKEYSLDEKKALLSAFIRLNGTIGLLNNPSIVLKSELGPIIKLLRLSIKDIYDLDTNLSFEKKIRFGKGIIYTLKLQDKKVYEILEDLEVLDNNLERMEIKKFLNPNLFPSFIFGLFLSSGSINNPSSTKTSYFLEIAFSSFEEADIVKSQFDKLKEENTISFKYIARRDKHILYLKKSDQISVFLSFIGATSSMFDFENVRIMKDDLNVYNRLSICDMANFSRTIGAASKDIEIINKLLEVKPLDQFDKKTQAVIQTRIKYNEASFRELVSIIYKEYNIVISKSGIAYSLSLIRNEYKKLIG